MIEVRRTTCNRDCPDACSILVTVDEGRAMRLAGDPNHPITQGFLCHRTSRFLQLQYGSNRLTTPLVRKNGRLEPTSFDEAMDLVASSLIRIRAESGPASIFHYRSGGSLGLLKVLTDYFFEAFGPVSIKRGDICSGAAEAAQLGDFGECDSHDIFDLMNARHIILWGKNAAVSSPHTLAIVKRARANGAKTVLIDPVHNKTAHHVDAFYPIRPGGDAALAMAVASILFARGWIDGEAAQFCENLVDFRRIATSRSVEGWCREADLPITAAEDLALRLGPGKPCTILVGWGMGRRTNGAASVSLLDALGAISGNLGIPGGGVSFYFKRRGAYDTSFCAGERAAPRTICEPLFGREILSATNPPIRAVWITAGNPVVMLPESKTTASALASRELVVVVDPFFTDTAKHATVVFPTTTLLEADDLLGSYGHHYLGVAEPVVRPPAGIRSDLEIVQALAARVGLEHVVAGDAASWKERMTAPRLGPHAIGPGQLAQGHLRNPLAPKVLFEGRRFPTQSRKVRLPTQIPTPPAAPPEAWPLLLMALTTEKSQCSQWASEPDELVARVHPSSASHIPEGQLAMLRSPLGEMQVKLHRDPQLRPDVIAVPKGGPYEGNLCANSLVSARLTDEGEGAALYEERVRLDPL